MGIDLRKKKIVVTGGAGFLGSRVVQALIERGVPAENILVPRSKEFDLRKWENCQRVVEGQDVVFDFASVIGDLLFRKEMPGTVFYDNLIMGIQIMEAARLQGVEKIITVGSAAEYPETAPVPLQEKDLWNGLPTAINIPYGLAKRMLLVQGQSYRQQYGFNAIHLLLTNTFGPGERAESGYVMPSLIQKVIDAHRKGKGVVEVWGTGEAMLDFLYFDDAVEGILLAAEKYNELEPLNIGSGIGISVKDLVELICKLAGFSGSIQWDTSKPGGQLRRILDVSRAKSLLGFSAKTPLEEGLRKTIQWHQEMIQ